MTTIDTPWMTYVVKERVCTGHPQKPGEPCGNRPVDQCSWHLVKWFLGDGVHAISTEREGDQR